MSKSNIKKNVGEHVLKLKTMAYNGYCLEVLEASL